MLRDCQFLTILISKSVSRAGVVQILATSTSKSVGHRQFLTILTSKSLLRRAQAGCKFCRRLGQPILRARPFLGADFSRQRSHETMEKHSVCRKYAQVLPAKQNLISHIWAVSHLRDRISWLTDLQRQLSV